MGFFWASGFRPLLLLTGLSGAVLLGVWTAALLGVINVSPGWHAHEMVFGFAAVAQAGFLSAAVPNWTGRRSLKGLWLGVVILLWLVGRGAVALDVFLWLDLLFLPAVALSVGWDILRARNWRNGAIPVILLTEAALNGLSQLDTPLETTIPAVYVICALLALIGGRVVPAFTRNALRAAGDMGADCPTPKWIGRLTVPMILMTALTELFHPGQSATGYAALATGLTLLAQMAQWKTLRALNDPLVWVLHAGYGWLPLGFLLTAAAALGGQVATTQALHALTAGAVGTMILAIASRAIRGHTGRPLTADRFTVISYLLVIVGAVLRVVWPDGMGLVAAGGLWSSGYLLFVVVHAPMLLRP